MRILAAAGAFALALLALAQPARATTVQIDQNQNGVVCKSGCASAQPFTNIDPNVSLTATSTSSKAAITAGGTVLELTNGGANQVEAVLCPTTTCTASGTSSIIIPAGQTVPVAIGVNTEVAVYAATGSNAVTAVSGTGSGYAVGGGGGGGGGGAVTIADGASATLGAKADAKAANTDSTPITAMQVLKEISAMVQAPPAQAVTPTALTSTDNSSTITAGGTFQTLLAASGSRKGCTIENPTTATEPLYVSFTAATVSASVAHSFSLSPGGFISCSIGGSGVEQGNIAVEAATTGHAFVERDQ